MTDGAKRTKTVEELRIQLKEARAVLRRLEESERQWQLRNLVIGKHLERLLVAAADTVRNVKQGSRELVAAVESLDAAAREAGRRK